MKTETVVLVLIPFVSALIGWVTNYIAVKMIFRPRNPVNIFGYELRGLIPRRKSELARTIGETVERELLSHRDIQQALNNPGFHTEISKVLRHKVDDFFDSSFGSNPLFAMFLGGDLAVSVKDILVGEIEKLIPDTLDMLLGKLESKLDFKEIVRTKIEKFELDKLEQIVFTIAARELRSIEIFGGVLGFVVGVVQVALILVSRLYA